jgi:NFU1 iron-sulfur cluster scaffold homolog, mitochondrial
MIKITHVEPTPNPNAFKFMTDTVLVKHGALSFESPEQAQRERLAREVFAAGGINSVYVQENFVSVNGQPGTDWEMVRGVVQEALTFFTPIEGVQAAPVPPDNPDALLAKVCEVVDRFVRPALASDGGGLEIVDIDGNAVLVRYQGACGGCASSTRGTLIAIENLLRDQVDPNLQVVSV